MAAVNVGRGPTECLNRASAAMDVLRILVTGGLRRARLWSSPNAFMSGPAGRMVEALKARVARGIHLIVHRLQTFEFGLDGCVLGVDGRHACVRSVA